MKTIRIHPVSFILLLLVFGSCIEKHLADTQQELKSQTSQHEAYNQIIYIQDTLLTTFAIDSGIYVNRDSIGIYYPQDSFIIITPPPWNPWVLPFDLSITYFVWRLPIDSPGIPEHSGYGEVNLDRLHLNWIIQRDTLVGEIVSVATQDIQIVLKRTKSSFSIPQKSTVMQQVIPLGIGSKHLQLPLTSLQKGTYKIAIQNYKESAITNLSY